MLRELHIADQPRRLAGRVAGCDVLAWDGADRCCGFGGTFSVKLPEVSVAMADEKLDALAAHAPGADLLVGCDTSCLLHLQTRAEATGRPLHVRHLAELLAAALPHEPDPARGARPDGEPA